MFDALLISVTAFGTGFTAAWLLGTRTRERLAAAEARAGERAKAAEEKLELVADTRGFLARELKAMSADALSESNRSFLELAAAKLETIQERAQGDLEARRKAVDALVQPIAESLVRVDGKLGEIELKREHAYASIDTQLKRLVETDLPMLHGETAKLAQSLRQPAARGRWGEVQLKRVVELAGMLEHCDFLEQQSGDAEDGRLRPDLIVRLPGGRQIVVDSKAPYDAYLAAHEATDDDARTAHLRRHAQVVRSHMTALGRKAYWETFSPSPDLVIMFLPGEMFYRAALESDPELIEAGANEKVLLAGPTTLIGLLRAIALGWREEALARNAEEVAELGKQLYERIAKLAAHWTEVGARLEKTVVAYNASVATLESRVLVTARKFQELKAAPEGEEIEAPAPVDVLPRVITAPELVDATSPPAALPEILGTPPRPVAAPEHVPGLPVAALERFARTG
jgi:DNA recombination protein RmuC